MGAKGDMGPVGDQGPLANPGSMVSTAKCNWFFFFYIIN